MDDKKYLFKCKKCGWQGTEENLDSEIVDTCLGDDPVWICPECGSNEVTCTYIPAAEDQTVTPPFS